jgi:tRNA dimethylallyltransferase
VTETVATIAAPAPGELLVVVGPTASGKTELAIRLAERFDGEIISADSVQVYRRFDIGSGKPTADESARARHHLVDIVDPEEPMDAGIFANRAEEALTDLRARGKTPIVCGGTFLWVKALLWGLAESGPRDEAVRERHRAIAETEGRAALHARLAGVDPEAAARLAPNDLLRVSRALEVMELTGKTQSAWHAAHAFATKRHAFRLLQVDRERQDIDGRIEARAKAWLAAGWVDEVAGLVRDGFGEARAMASVGYREVHAHLRGEIPAGELLGAIVRGTRVFVRRQRTWLRDLETARVSLD